MAAIIRAVTLLRSLEPQAQNHPPPNLTAPQPKNPKRDVHRGHQALSPERLPAEGQMAFMREAIPLLEQEKCLGVFGTVEGLGFRV